MEIDRDVKKVERMKRKRKHSELSEGESIDIDKNKKSNSDSSKYFLSSVFFYKKGQGKNLLTILSAGWMFLKHCFARFFFYKRDPGRLL